MNATNFRFIKIERDKRGTDEVLWLRAVYDYVDAMLQDRPAQLEVQYQGQEVKSVSLDMHYLIPTPKDRIYFEDNTLVRVETWSPYPSMGSPKDSVRKIDGNYLRKDANLKAMVGLIPDNEPVKAVLEDLVR